MIVTVLVPSYPARRLRVPLALTYQEEALPTDDLGGSEGFRFPGQGEYRNLSQGAASLAAR
jgi:hypothetical protein